MSTIMFQPRFAPMVEQGIKLQTVRPIGKRPRKVGDVVSLRQWSGLPYRSKQIILRDKVTLTRVQPCTIALDYPHPITVDGQPVDADRFARYDGFATALELLTWFRREHSLPFSGQLIVWEARTSCIRCGTPEAHIQLGPNFLHYCVDCWGKEIRHG